MGRINTVNMNYMETVVRFIVSLCLDYNINTGDIQENMLAMGNYIREFQEASKNMEVTIADNERLTSEVKHLNIQLESYRTMYEGYRKFTTSNMKNSKVDGNVLVERMLGLENEIEKLRDQNNTMLIKYSYAYGRKDDYKDQFLNLKKINEEERKAAEEAKKVADETI